eukprot:4130534-Pyramimonas_sp.AAC.1
MCVTLRQAPRGPPAPPFLSSCRREPASPGPRRCWQTRRRTGGCRPGGPAGPRTRTTSELREEA